MSREALVASINTYLNLGNLTNPASDAEAIAKILLKGLSRE